MEHFLGFLGLAKKAGKLAVGEDPVYEAVSAGTVRLILVASDAAEASRRRAADYAAEAGAFCLALPADKKRLGAALGKNLCALCAVTDIGFAAELARRLQCLTEDEGATFAAERLALKKKRRDERAALKESGVKREKPGGRELKREKPPRKRAESSHSREKPAIKERQTKETKRVSHEPPASIPGRNREERKGKGAAGKKPAAAGTKGPRGKGPGAFRGKTNGMGQRKGRS